MLTLELSNRKFQILKFRGEVWHHVIMAAKFLDHKNEEIKQGDGNGNNNGKKAVRKTTTLHVYHAFLYIS